MEMFSLNFLIVIGVINSLFSVSDVSAFERRSVISLPSNGLSVMAFM